MGETIWFPPWGDRRFRWKRRPRGGAHREENEEVSDEFSCIYMENVII